MRESIINIDAERAAKKLSEMIKIKTISNKTYDYIDKVNLAHDKYRELFPFIHKRAEIKYFEGTILYKLEGCKKSKLPIMLMSHTDVVEAKGEWKHEPFGGIIEDGRVWGRGTQDTKGNLCAIFEGVELLLENGLELEEDLYILSTHDEELMGHGAKLVSEYFKENDIRFSFVLDEGGAVIEKAMPGVEIQYAMLGVMEKGYGDIKFTAKAKGGHSSTPKKDNPVARISAFVNEVNSKPPFKVKLTKPVKEMLTNLSKNMKYPYKFIFSNLWLTAPIVKLIFKKLEGQPLAMLKTSCVFTMVKGSDAPNVIPAEASVIANMRFMIHEGMEDSLNIMKRIAQKYELDMEILKAHDCSVSTDINSEGYKFIEENLKNTFPEVGVAPYVMLGGTDSRHFTDVTDAVIRFAPIIMDSQQLNSVHGIDENIYVESLKRAVEFYTKLVIEYNSLGEHRFFRTKQ